MDAAIHEYVDPSPLAKMVRLGLALFIVVSAVSIVSTAFEYQLLERMRDHGSFPGMQESAEANDLRQRIVAITFLLAFAVSGFLILRWTWRCNKNLHASGVAMEYTPGWAVGWYFIPFANLWKPYQAMREIWQSSLGQTESLGRLPLWWTMWLLSNFAGNLSFRLSRADDIGLLLGADIAGIVSDATQIATAALLLQIVARITGAQRALPTVTETIS